MDLQMIETGMLSIIPPLLAIILALTTKEVYSSLFLGVLSGTVIYCICGGGSFVQSVQYIFDMMATKIGDNAYMVVFLALLWAVIEIVNRSGGTKAYGKFVGTKLKNPVAVKLATAFLGVLIFIDDGFNCLTVGTVMRPIADKHKIAREKLAYIVDSTAAPVCIIAPVSSWAVAVASQFDETHGFNTFLKTIPYNLYAILTLIMVFFVCATNFDFGPMKKACEKALSNSTEKIDDTNNNKGTVLDLVLPIAVLIVTAILGMAFVGGFFSGVPFSAAIGENPVAGLVLGTFAGLITALIMYLPRKIMSFNEFISTIVNGIKNVVPPIIILIFSWALSGVCRDLIGTGVFISGVVNSAQGVLRLLPLVVFLVSAVMSFSMGSSWGTFGMLIPIVIMICSGAHEEVLLIPALSATLAGSVFGDHCSPISDTTILSSTGAQCEHISHVSTQIPYALLVASVCAVGYLFSGLFLNPWIPLVISIALLFICFAVIKTLQKKTA